jgi:hypothetical protein
MNVAAKMTESIRLIDDVALAIKLGYLDPAHLADPAAVRKAREGVRKLVSRTPALQKARRPLATDKRGRPTILRYQLQLVDAFIADPMKATKQKLQEVTS